MDFARSRLTVLGAIQQCRVASASSTRVSHFYLSHAALSITTPHSRLFSSRAADFESFYSRHSAGAKLLSQYTYISLQVMHSNTQTSSILSDSSASLHKSSSTTPADHAIRAMRSNTSRLLPLSFFYHYYGAHELLELYAAARAWAEISADNIDTIFSKAALRNF